jgi:hypothetical protein
MSTRQPVTTMAIGLGLVALLIFVGYIAWIGFRL